MKAVPAVVAIAVGALLTACTTVLIPPVHPTSTVPSALAVPSLAGLKPCALLTQAQLSQLGLTSGQPDGQECLFPPATSNGTELSVQLYPNTTASGIGPNNRKLTIGRHQAVETTQSMTSQCDINLLVGDNVIVIVGTGVTLGVGPACTVATKAARLIEATMP
jgi:hypothetical protein